MAQQKDIQCVLQKIESRYAPDKRVVVFDVKPSYRKDTLVLKGEISHTEAYRQLLAEVKKLHPHVKDDIRLLPDDVIGEKTWGVIYNSAEKVHARNAYSSEVVSEVLLGMPVKLFDKKGGWRRIQTPEGYIGWISDAVEPMTETDLRNYNKKPKIVVTSLFAVSYESADVQSQPVSDLVAGNMVELKGTQGAFFQVVYPDGREAYVQKTDAKELNLWLNDIELTPESVVKTARRFSGIPYVWGGTSSKGLDCSGFTKTVYLLHGVVLARDASQQVKYGKLIDSTGDFSRAQPGDLVFFGEKATAENPKERVVHVGIYIGNKRFIHASDYIRVNSFDPKDPLYDAYNTQRYLRTKRVIGEVNTTGMEEIVKNEFYQ